LEFDKLSDYESASVRPERNLQNFHDNGVLRAICVVDERKKAFESAGGQETGL
jgi:hypothetical protein